MENENGRAVGVLVLCTLCHITAVASLQSDRGAAARAEVLGRGGAATALLGFTGGGALGMDLLSVVLPTISASGTRSCRVDNRNNASSSTTSA